MITPPVEPEPEIEPLVIRDGSLTWNFDWAFLSSNWTCVWGRGCQGILDEPAEELQQGCCSVGAELDDENEARMVSAMAAMIDPALFQHHREAADGIFRAGADGAGGWATRVVDDACIFLNRPGFEGGVGCALHLSAIANGESPIDWKPSVCWQLPVHVDIGEATDGSETANVRAWRRSDWGDEGETMAWCCTEEPAAYVGTERVIDSMATEIEAIVGTAVFVELTRRLAP